MPGTGPYMSPPANWAVVPVTREIETTVPEKVRWFDPGTQREVQAGHDS